MKRRIAIWAGVGLLVAAFWAIYLLRAGLTSSDPLWTLVRLTCPIAFASRFPISVYSALLANAGTYALFGLLVESVRKQLKQAG